MKNENGITLIKLILIIVLVLILVGFIYFLATDNSTDVTNKMPVNEIAKETIIDSTNSVDNANDEDIDIEITTFADASKYEIGDMITAGTITIGYIDLPSVKIKYPIASKVTTDPALAYSPAYLYGPGINQVGRTIIVGMVNSFEGIDKLKVNDTLNLIDDENVEKQYTITEIKDTKSDDSSFGISKDKTKCEVALALVYNEDVSKRLVVIAEER